METDSGEIAIRGGGLMPANLEQAMTLARLLAESDLAPPGYRGKPGNVIVALQFGWELGLAPMQALQNISVINGKPSVYGDALIGIVHASGLLESMEETTEGDGDQFRAVCTMRRKGIAEPFVSRFSVADAKRAGLWNKVGPWQSYPKRMLQMRARGFCVRDAFADRLKGLIAREEAEDYLADGASNAPRIQPPKRRSEASHAPAGEPPAAQAPAQTPATAPPVTQAAQAHVGTVPQEVAKVFGVIHELPPAKPAPVPAGTYNGKPYHPKGEGYISEAQGRRLYAIAKNHGLTSEQVNAYLRSRGVDGPQELGWMDYDAVIGIVEQGANGPAGKAVAPVASPAPKEEAPF